MTLFRQRVRTILLITISVTFMFSLVQAGESPSYSSTRYFAPDDPLTVEQMQNEIVIDEHEFDFQPMATVSADANWSDEFQCPGVDGQVWASAVFNGDLYIAGYFSHIGEMYCPYIARYDGTEWHNVFSEWDEDGVGDIGTSTVKNIFVWDNKLIITGDFAAIDGVAANHIAAYDGTNIIPLGNGFNNPGQCLSEYNGDLIAGGYFSAAGGYSAEYLARWDGDNWYSMNFSDTSSVITSCKIEHIRVWDGNLYVAGRFRSPNGDGLSMWDGTSWNQLGNGISNDSLDGRISVSAMEVYDNKLYVGGSYYGFTHVDGIHSPNLAVWDGTNWDAFGGTNAKKVYQLKSHLDQLYIAGDFDTLDGTAYANIASYNGAVFQSLGVGVDGLWVECLGTYDDKLIAGGTVQSIGDVHDRVAAWNGTSWERLTPEDGLGFDEQVEALHVWNDQLIAGGYFDHAGGEPVQSIATWNGAGWDPVGQDIWGYDISLGDYNGNLLAGGKLYLDGYHFGLLQFDGTSWSSVSGGIDITPGRVHAIAEYNGDLYVGGYFNINGSEDSYCIARWDGTSWSPLGDGLGNHTASTGKRVYALEVYEGKLYVGGYFGSAGGLEAVNIAAWDGTVWSQVGGTGTDFYKKIDNFAVYDNKLIISGIFYYMNGVPVNSMAAWDGSTWEHYGIGTTIGTMMEHDGLLYIAGSVIEGASARVAAWNGACWARLGSATNYSCNDIAFYNGSIWVAGDFSQAGGKASAKIARWDGTISGCICCINGTRGNVNYDEGDITDISDLVFMVDFMFNYGEAPMCNQEADINGDGNPIIDISDLVTLVNYMFNSGPTPPSCPE